MGCCVVGKEILKLSLPPREHFHGVIGHGRGIKGVARLSNRLLREHILCGCDHPS